MYVKTSNQKKALENRKATPQILLGLNQIISDFTINNNKCVHTHTSKLIQNYM